MHNSDSQEELVDEYMKYEVSDALIYKEFDYDKTEWDNIPSLIPRFVTFLSKHMESLTKICHERFTQISTPDLQLLMEEKLATLENKVNILLSEGSAARQALAERVAKLESETNNLKNESENMKRTQKEQWTTDLKKIIPIPTEEDYIKEFEKEEQMADEEAKVKLYQNFNLFIVRDWFAWKNIFIIFRETFQKTVKISKKVQRMMNLMNLLINQE